MATGKRSAATVPDDEALAQARQLLLDEDTFSGETLSPALESLYAELGMVDGNDATVHVTLLEPDATESQIWKGAPDDYDLENLARKFGSGKYRVKVYVKIETGQKVLKANKIFSWRLSPEDEARRLAPQTPPQNNAMNPVDLSRIIADAIKAAMPPAPVAPPVNPFQQMKELAEVMTMMRGSAPEPAQVNPLEQLRAMAGIMADLKGDSEDALPRTVNSNGMDLLNNLITKFVPLLMQALPAMQAGAVQPAQLPAPQEQPQPLQPQAVVQPAGTYPTQQPTQTESPEVMQLKMGLQFLMVQCEAGNDPLTYANVVLDNVPDDFVQALLSNPQPLDVLGQYIPNIKNPPYADWFTQLLNECREMLKEDAPGLPEVPPNPLGT